MLIITLYLAPPIMVLLYKILEYCGFWNHISGRDNAINTLNRLKTATGFPDSFIYNNEKDRKEFDALFTRIKKKTKIKKIIKVLGAGNEPSLLTTGGNPTSLGPLPDGWKQEERFYYSQNHPILMVFEKEGKGDKCCTLGELEKWIDDERKNWDFILGTIIVTIFTIASILLRIELIN